MWFFALIVVVLIGAVAVVASGRWGAMSTAYDDRPDMSVPARQTLTSDDIETARFGVGLRGYRMDEVDTLLERVAREVAERDRRIADLERAVTPIMHGPEGAGFASRHTYDPADFDDTGYQLPILVGGNFPTDTTTPAPAPEASETQPAPEATAAQPALDAPAAQSTAEAPEARPVPDAPAAQSTAEAPEATAAQSAPDASAVHSAPGAPEASTPAAEASEAQPVAEAHAQPALDGSAIQPAAEALPAQPAAEVEAQAQPATAPEAQQAAHPGAQDDLLSAAQPGVAQADGSWSSQPAQPEAQDDLPWAAQPEAPQTGQLGSPQAAESAPTYPAQAAPQAAPHVAEPTAESQTPAQREQAAEPMQAAQRESGQQELAGGGASALEAPLPPVPPEPALQSQDPAEGQSWFQGAPGAAPEALPAQQPPAAQQEEQAQQPDAQYSASAQPAVQQPEATAAAEQVESGWTTWKRPEGQQQSGAELAGPEEGGVAQPAAGQSVVRDQGQVQGQLWADPGAAGVQSSNGQQGGPGELQNGQVGQQDGPAGDQAPRGRHSAAPDANAVQRPN